jgi:thiamine biosynthesis protein ThiS
MAEIGIYLNGQLKEIPSSLTVEGLVKLLDLVPERLAIEYNLQILKRDKWSQQQLSEGDKLEMVHFVGGG